MKKIFVSFLILSCLVKPLSVAIAMAEEIGDVFPGQAPNIQHSLPILPTLKAPETSGTRVDSSVGKTKFLREKSVSVNISDPLFVQFFVCFFLVLFRSFLLSYCSVFIHLRSPPAAL
jgi:hypothetical protein